MSLHDAQELTDNTAYTTAPHQHATLYIAAFT